MTKATRTNVHKKNMPHRVSRQRAPARPAAPSKIALSQCGEDFATIVGNAFKPIKRPACTPDFPVRESQKVAGFVEGSATIGVNGNGFVALTPSMANDLPSAYSSTATYDPTVTSGNIGQIRIDSVELGANRIAQHFVANLPYSQGAFGSTNTNRPEALGRIVASGVEVTYDGTELNKSGTTYAYGNPNHQNLNFMSLSELTARSNTVSSRVGDKAVQITVSPISHNEVGYSGADAVLTPGAHQCYPYADKVSVSTSIAAVGAVVAVIFFTGVPGQKFRFRIRTHCEFTGILTQNMQTASHGNSADFNAVMTAKSKVAHDRGISATGVARSVLQTATAILNDPISRNFAYRAGKAAYGYARGGPMGGAQQLLLTNG